MSNTPAEALQGGKNYSWDELGNIFGFRPGYLAVGGGMLTSNPTNSLLLITHPSDYRTRSLYEDYWDGDELIYGARGQVGDQQLVGANLAVVEGTRDLYVFEAVHARTLRYVGMPTCTECRESLGEDSNGEMRRVYEFRLTFREDVRPEWKARRVARKRVEQPIRGNARQFDRGRPPSKAKSSGNPQRPEEALALTEKAKAGHHQILCQMADHLEANGWSYKEFPLAIDLFASREQGRVRRIIFEAKTISGANEAKQCRGGLAQLLEYRLVLGEEDDAICLVTDSPISVPRARILNELGVALIWCPVGDLRAGNDLGTRLLAEIQAS